MKPQISLTIPWKSVAVAVALALVVGVAGVQAAPQPNQITVRSQDLTSGVITVDKVIAGQDGWIVVYKDSSNFTPNQVVGYAPVHQGVNDNVKVTLDTAKVGDLPTLWVVLQADSGLPGVFEWGLRGRPLDDAPIVQNGAPVVASFGTAASMAQATTAPAAPAAPAPAASAPAAAATPKAPVSTKPAAGASSIVIPDQDLTSGVIKVSSANSPVDGWIVVYKDPSNFTTGQVVGYAPVHKGANSDVKVTIDTAKAADSPTLWAVLQADNGVPGVFEWGLRGRPLDDALVVENGHNIVTSFGTAASMAQTTTAPAVPAGPAPVATATPSAPASTKPAATTKPAASTNPIVLRNQDITSGVIVVDSATSPVDGWIVFYKDPNNLTSAQIVGYAPVHQGVNKDVKVTLDTAKVGDAPTLWAVLQADNGNPGVFEWGLRSLPYDDAPIVQNGHNIVAGFGTAAAQ